ncbi:MAG: hypothetical protein JWQ63_4412 [Mucilaginibacter sp.]|jgi:hypothetical protein|nr:hypothetical protein [Mucilaginibacter sp.]
MATKESFSINGEALLKKVKELITAPEKLKTIIRQPIAKK